MINVVYLEIFPAKVRGIIIDKGKIHSADRVIFDAVARTNIHLHTVVRDKIVIAPAHNFVGGVIEKIVGVKLQNVIRGKIVIKQLLAYIYGIAEIDAVVPEV